VIHRSILFRIIRKYISTYKTDFYIGRDGVQVNKIIDDAYLVKEANEHFAEVFYGTFLADYTDGNAVL